MAHLADLTENRMVILRSSVHFNPILLSQVHFNSFMLDVHKKLHAEKANVARVTASDQARYFDPSGTYTIRSRPHDPIPPVARAIADEAWFLCFDEFQVCGKIQWVYTT